MIRSFLSYLLCVRCASVQLRKKQMLLQILIVSSSVSRANILYYNQQIEQLALRYNSRGKFVGQKTIKKNVIERRNPIFLSLEMIQISSPLFSSCCPNMYGKRGCTTTNIWETTNNSFQKIFFMSTKGEIGMLKKKDTKYKSLHEVR